MEVRLATPQDAEELLEIYRYYKIFQPYDNQDVHDTEHCFL